MKESLEKLSTKYKLWETSGRLSALFEPLACHRVLCLMRKRGVAVSKSSEKGGYAVLTRVLTFLKWCVSPLITESGSADFIIAPAHYHQELQKVKTVEDFEAFHSFPHLKVEMKASFPPEATDFTQVNFQGSDCKSDGERSRNKLAEAVTKADVMIFVRYEKDAADVYEVFAVPLLEALCSQQEKELLDRQHVYSLKILRSANITPITKDNLKDLSKILGRAFVAKESGSPRVKYNKDEALPQSGSVVRMMCEHEDELKY